MTTKIKAAGYIRVSTAEQVEGESLNTQRKSITDFANHTSYDLVEIYADEGISGGNVKDRHALLRCLQDGLQGKFSVLIIHRMSRFGRNALELLNNYKELKNAGIELRSISEGIDFSTKYGEAMLGMLAVIAQLERDIIRETLLENRVARGKRGVPTSGKLPYARTFNRETGEWTLDENKARVIRQVANDFLNGEPLARIAEKVQIEYNSLLKILSKRSGDEWTVTFKDEDPIIYQIPRILDDEVIERVRERLAFNKKNNRTDVINKYLLSGFIRCEKCKYGLSGTTHTTKYSVYHYYHHKKSPDCQALTHVYVEPIEKAVFETIFENIADVPRWEKAIAESLPDDRMIKQLQGSITEGERELKRISKELDRLVESVLKGTLTDETIRAKEQELLKQRAHFEQRYERDKAMLQSLPDAEEVKKDADKIRRMLLERYSGQERLQEMTFDEKRDLLHWLFDGKDHEGRPYGIYVSASGRAKKQQVDYFLYGKITGLRTLKDGNINYNNDGDKFESKKPARREKGHNLRCAE